MAVLVSPLQSIPILCQKMIEVTKISQPKSVKIVPFRNSGWRVYNTKIIVTSLDHSFL